MIYIDPFYPNNKKACNCLWQHPGTECIKTPSGPCTHATLLSEWCNIRHWQGLVISAVRTCLPGPSLWSKVSNHCGYKWSRDGRQAQPVITCYHTHQSVSNMQPLLNTVTFPLSCTSYKPTNFKKIKPNHCMKKYLPLKTRKLRVLTLHWVLGSKYLWSYLIECGCVTYLVERIKRESFSNL